MNSEWKTCFLVYLFLGSNETKNELKSNYFSITSYIIWNLHQVRPLSWLYRVDFSPEEDWFCVKKALFHVHDKF